jgi:signal transduction histidine kinase
MSVRLFGGRGVLIVSLGCAILTVAGYLLSPGDLLGTTAIANRLLSLSAIGATTFLALRHRSAQMALCEMSTQMARIRSADLCDAVGNVIRKYVTSIDIEEQKRSDVARRGSETHLISAQRLSRTGSLIVNLTTKEFSWSDETFRIFEYDQSITPTAELILARVHPDDRAIMKAHWARRHLRKPFDFQFRLLFPDGRIKHLHAIGDATENSGPDVTYIGAVMDVTQAKQAEDELHQAHAALAHVTRVITLGELAASIAHEVNQPLAGIVTNGEACIRWIDRDVPDLAEVRSAVGRIISDGRLAADVIRRLRTLSRKADTERVPLNINEVVSEALGLVQGEIATHRIFLKLDLHPDVPMIAGDKVLLQQVVINLVVNGIQAMADTSGRQASLLVRSRRHGDDGVMVSVIDVGIGIDPKHVDTLFNPFFTTKPHGLGMGLSICRSIIEAHGGLIWASNNNAFGATFNFTLQNSPERDPRA